VDNLFRGLARHLLANGALIGGTCKPQIHLWSDDFMGGHKEIA
jgi:hypothetical protein